jgi:hypothetical protein
MKQVFRSFSRAQKTKNFVHFSELERRNRKPKRMEASQSRAEGDEGFQFSFFIFCKIARGELSSNWLYYYLIINNIIIN